jgi:5-(carboxyamino)imidazole ribonucleotide synthase
VDIRTGLPVVGMVGAGQLARMTQQAATSLGQSVRILAESADDAAALVAADVIVGDYRSLDDLRAFAKGCDVLTFDHEHVPNQHLQALVGDGVNVQPNPAALQFAQDKLAMRSRLSDLGIPCPKWAPIVTAANVRGFAERVGWPIVLKATSGGYDGRGVWLVDSPTDAETVLASGVELLAEQRISIARELAAVVARSPFRQGAAWPVVETVQQAGICVEVIAPAPGLPDAIADEAQALALKIAEQLDVTGILAVELFLTENGELLVNELAMRPHNSGHWTIEGSHTSQFEQHLRAILDYPLGPTALTTPAVVMANVLGGPDDVEPPSLDERVHRCLAQWPDVKIHLYGKRFRPGRKLGHVTALAADVQSAHHRARAAARCLAQGDRA